MCNTGTQAPFRLLFLWGFKLKHAEMCTIHACCLDATLATRIGWRGSLATEESSGVASVAMTDASFAENFPPPIRIRRSPRETRAKTHFQDVDSSVAFAVFSRQDLGVGMFMYTRV